MRHKCKIGTIIIALVIGICFTIKVEARLNDMEMSKIVGKCGCHTTSYGSCNDEGAKACGNSCHSCKSYKIGGSQGQKCVTRAPHNTATCKPNGATICQVSVICDSEAFLDEECKTIEQCQPKDDTQCSQCGFVNMVPIPISNYYCG